MMEKLFICATYYHTLITLIKSFVNCEQYCIYLADNIPSYQVLKENLEKTGQLKVFVFPVTNINMAIKPHNSRLARILCRKREIRNAVENNCNLDLRDYELYLYHDYSNIGKYCAQEGIYYHLIEDALDYFKYFDKYYNMPKQKYTKGSFEDIIKEKTGLGLRLWGTSPYCIDIEVNDLNGIKISKDKVFEMPRKKLFEKLTDEQKRVIYDTYACNKVISKSGTQNEVLICTQPLYKDKHVSTLNDQMIVFEKIIKKFADMGHHITIKPHPRDDADYTGLISKYDCGYIDKDLPSEILNYNPDARYVAAVSVTSTAINFLEYANEKIFMGLDFVNEVLCEKDA